LVLQDCQLADDSAGKTKNPEGRFSSGAVGVGWWLKQMSRSIRFHRTRAARKKERKSKRQRKDLHDWLCTACRSEMQARTRARAAVRGEKASEFAGQPGFDGPETFFQ
jgi:hypothetical protein